jgi:integrase
MNESDLLFPSATSGFAASSALQKPFSAVAKAVGIKKKITPRAMRRTFQDLARAADVKDIVTRRISGHATETMQHHYSTVAQDEMREAISKVTALAGYDHLADDASRGGAEVVREPSNDNCDQSGSSENPTQNQ